MPSKIDLIGLQVGKLRVERAAPSRNSRTYWECRCSCGAVVCVTTDALRRGVTTSCGCYKRDLQSRLCRQRMKTHGMSTMPEYKVWDTMRQRCSNPKNGKYQSYGARGISVCERWDDFTAFISDMGPRPSSVHSLDRINPNGDYEPGNVRWATQKEQQNNRTDNRKFTINGETKTVSEWANMYRIRPNIVTQRINRDGWSIERALGILMA